MSDRNELSTPRIIRRKVQVVGGNTITVSLPRSWADKHKIGRDSGQEQEIAMRYMPDGSLMISPANLNVKHVERSRMHKFSTVHIDTVKRTIIADFLGGIDLIHIRWKDEDFSEIIPEIRNFVGTRLIGFDTIETEYGFDVVNMTQAPKFQVNKLLEIIRVQSEKMMKKCYQWLNEPDHDPDKLIRKMHELEITLDRRSNQMMRTIQLSILDYWVADSVNLPHTEIIYWSVVTRAIENTADLTVAIAEAIVAVNIDKVDQQVLNELIELGDVISSFFSDAISSFIKNDHNLALEIMTEQTKYSATITKKWPIQSADNLGGKLTLVLRHLEKIGNYARKIAEATLDCEAARVAYLEKEG